MVRVPLEELVLQIHLLGLGPAGQFLERVLEPPPKASVEGALAQLQALGALTAQQQLTPLGRLHLHYKEACICLKLCGKGLLVTNSDIPSISNLPTCTCFVAFLG